LKGIILRHVGDMSGAHVIVLGAVNNAIAERLATQPPPTPLEPRTETPVELAQLRDRVRGLSQVETDAIVNDLLTAGILEYCPPPRIVGCRPATSSADQIRAELRCICR
jgi:hypothetical protein